MLKVVPYQRLLRRLRRTNLTVVNIWCEVEGLIKCGVRAIQRFVGKNRAILDRGLKAPNGTGNVARWAMTSVRQFAAERDWRLQSPAPEHQQVVQMLTSATPGSHRHLHCRLSLQFCACII